MNLNRRKTRIIGVIVPWTTDPFYSEITRLVQMRCIRSGYLTIVLSSHGDRDLEVRAIQTLRSLKVSGVIIAPLGFLSDESLLSTLKGDVPVVFLDSRLDDSTPFVGTDNLQSVSLAVEYLSRTGDPPSFLEMPEVNQNAVERRAAYLQTMARLGLQAELISPEAYHSWNFEEVGYTEALRLIDGSGFPTSSVLCANDRLAFGVMAAACLRRLKIGRGAGSDLRIAGHDDHPLSRYSCPALTTVAQDSERLGNLSTDILLSKIETDPREREAPGLDRVHLEAKLMMRESA
jgi:DNA-binding LacI/PurR family transcriptional regulator